MIQDKVQLQTTFYCQAGDSISISTSLQAIHHLALSGTPGQHL